MVHSKTATLSIASILMLASACGPAEVDDGGDAGPPVDASSLDGAPMTDGPMTDGSDACVPEIAIICSGGDVVARDVCTGASTTVETCPNACAAGRCVDCAPDAHRECVGDEVWSFDSCDAEEALVERCSNGCAAGACIASGCPSGRSMCDGRCVDSRTDTDHCGRCNNACSTAVGGLARCVAGRCENPCGDDGHLSCGGTCVDPQTHYDHCGGCDRACPTEAGCYAGVCRCLTPTQQICNGDCVDTHYDPAHCGGCNNACAPGTHCIDGERCGCDAPLEPCSGSCINLGTDPRNCGMCGRSCAAGAHCVEGRCAQPLMARDLSALDYNAFRIAHGCVAVAVRIYMPAHDVWWQVGYRANGFPYQDGTPTDAPGQVRIEVRGGPASPCDPGSHVVQSEPSDTITANLDGRSWRFRLPNVRPIAPSSYPALYPSTDGSLYFDRELTDLAIGAD